MRFVSHVVQATYELTIKTHLAHEKEINKRVLKIYTFFSGRKYFASRISQKNQKMGALYTHRLKVVRRPPTCNFTKQGVVYWWRLESVC